MSDALDLGGHRVIIGAQRVTTVFPDGQVLHATAVSDAESVERAGALGYSGPDAVWQMTRDHDLAHTLLALARGLRWSPTLRAQATGEPAGADVVGDEERVVLLLQRVANLGVVGAAR